MLVNSTFILKEAQKEGYAIGAYNINNIEWTKYILEACNTDKSPVILAVTEKAISYMGGYKLVSNMVKNLIESLKIKVPVVLHLDHGTSFLSCKEAIDAGFTSVMIDASEKSLDDNINIVRQVVDYAHRKSVTVEAEIGNIDDNKEPVLIEDCEALVSSTMVDSLAPSIGNKHGIYKGEATLDFELLGGICKTVKVPLVLHGASGLDDNKIKTCIFCGVSKININTDLQVAWASSVRNYLNENKDVYDPRKIISSGEKEIKRVVHSKNNLFGSINKLK